MPLEYYERLDLSFFGWVIDSNSMYLIFYIFRILFCWRSNNEPTDRFHEALDYVALDYVALDYVALDYVALDYVALVHVALVHVPLDYPRTNRGFPFSFSGSNAKPIVGQLLSLDVCTNVNQILLRILRLFDGTSSISARQVRTQKSQSQLHSDGTDLSSRCIVAGSFAAVGTWLEGFVVGEVLPARDSLLTGRL